MSVPMRFGCSKNCKSNYLLRFYAGLLQSAKTVWKMNIKGEKSGNFVVGNENLETI